jgi:hypothetical protein
MPGKQLLPQAFWFRFMVPCPRVEKMPLPRRARRLLDLPETSTLPDLKELEGGKSWARIRTGWNLGGLGFTVLAEGVAAEQKSGDRPEGFALTEFWVDTRDVRNVARATRFCHRFTAVLKLDNTGQGLDVQVTQQKIPRANADAPIRSPELITARAELLAKSWILELFLPADVLNGFDPELNRRFGFAYRIADYVRDDQYFTVGQYFPVGENPSLWSTLDLVD